MHISLTIAMEFHCRSLAGTAKSAILQKKLVVVTRRDSLVIEVPPGITEGLLCLFSFSPLSVLGVTFWGMFCSPCYQWFFHSRLDVVSTLGTAVEFIQHQKCSSQGADPRVRNWKLDSEGRAAGWIHRELRVAIHYSSPLPQFIVLCQATDVTALPHSIFRACWHSFSNRAEPAWRVKKFFLVLSVVLQISLFEIKWYNQSTAAFPACKLLSQP